MITFIRSLMFNLIFYPWAFLYLAIHGKYLYTSRKESMIVLKKWATHARRLMNVTLGLYYKEEGRENLPEAPYIIAAKHQSSWDTFVYPDFIEDPSIILKHDLIKIPLYGNFILKFDLIPVDRSKGASALKKMIRDAKRVCLEQKRPLLIFPEGTRIPPGEKGEYQAGVAALYSQLKIPVVPVATNSGMFWPRRKFCKKSGMIIVKFLPPIQPGLDKKEFMKRLENVIETESLKLLDRDSKGNKP